MSALTLRDATMSDAETLLEWRNDSLTREMSVSSDLISMRDHLKWLDSRLSRLEPNLFVGEVNGVRVGMVRVDGDELSYTVAPEYRDKGYAKKMLTIIKSRFGRLNAQIKPGNVPSIIAAYCAGHKVLMINGTAPPIKYL